MDFSFVDYINSFTNWEARMDRATPADFALDRVERLLEAFGRPDDRLRFVHVAGSKGKGSTCAFLAHVLRAAGYRVGLFTSPHLHDPRERIRVLEPERAGGGEPGAGKDNDRLSGRTPPWSRGFEGMITLEELVERALFYKAPVDELRRSGVEVTYFEYLTALAMSYFAARKAEVVVLETGLGGRLDATNAVDTMVCGITPVGLEHTKILGDTLDKIAYEKAGIIKSPSQRVAVAPQADAAMEVIRARCREFGIAPTIIGRDVELAVLSQDLGGVRFDLKGRREYRGLHTGLIGEHQAVNAALAVAMAEDLEVFGYMLTEEAVARGVSDASWPARFEVLRRDPLVVLDCAHTRESAAAFAKTFQSLFPGRRAVLVFGASSDKDLAALARELAPVTGRVVLARADNPRASELDLSDGARLFPGVEVERAASVGAALERASARAGKDGIMAVVGSVFLCAQARLILLDAF